MARDRIAKIIEDSLQSTRAARDEWRKTRSKASKAFSEQYDAMFYGQKELAEKLGYDCACVERGASLDQGVYCSCFPQKTQRKK